jgi:hypothetical protein
MSAGLVARARAAVAEPHGWSAMELAERGGKLMHFVTALCNELDDAEDPAGAQARREARLTEALERFEAEKAELDRKLADLSRPPV